MRKLLVVVVVLLVSACALAQDAPKGEIYGAYSYMRQRLGSELESVGLDHANANGFTIGGTGYFNNWFGIKAEFGGHYARPSIDTGAIIVPAAMTPQAVLPSSIKLKENLYTYMFGPTFAVRKSERVQPFVHALFGVAHVSVRAEADGLGTEDLGSQNAFAMQFGGGADFLLSKRVAIRGGFDYMHSSFDMFGINEGQNGLQVTAGVVFRLGGK